MGALPLQGKRSVESTVHAGLGVRYGASRGTSQGSLRPTLLQQGLQALDLILVLLEQGILGVLVDTGLILDGLGSRGVPQRRQRLVQVIVGGGDRCDHDRLRVPAERVLQQTRQFRVAIRDMALSAIHEGADDIAQG